jgi:type I restriction enzyme S subunit
MSAVDDESGTIVAAEERPFEQVKSGYTYFEENDVLFAKITPCMENGKAAIARGLLGGIGFGSTEFHVLRPHASVVPEWIWLFVRQERFREDAKKSFRGGVGQQRVPQEFLEQYLIPLPPLEEQRRIVARIEELMDRVREARRLRQEAQKDAERLWQSVLAQTFPRPGSDLPEGWRWVQLREVCKPTERRDPTKEPESTFQYVDISSVDNATGEIIGAKELLGKEAPSRARKVIRSNDVIFATTRPYLKNIAIVPPELDGQICSTGFCVLRANEAILEPRFLFYVCRSDLVVEQLSQGNMRGASYPAVTDKDVFDSIIPLPPLAEQRRIVAHLEAVQERLKALKEAQAATEAELKRLEQAILEKAFRGEL